MLICENFNLMNFTEHWLFRYTIIMVGILALFTILTAAKILLLPIVASMILAFALYPLVQGFERIGFHRILAITTALFIVVALLTLAVFLVGTQLNSFAQELPQISSKFEALLLSLQNFLESRFYIAKESQLDMLRDNMLQVFNTGTSIARTTITTTSSILFYVSLIPIYVFLMIYYKGLFYNFVMELNAKSNRKLATSIIDKTKDVVQDYISGMFMIIIIIAILNTVAFLILGLNNALFFGILIAILAIIPYFGIVLAASIAILYSFLTTDTLWQPVGIILITAVVQFIEGNFITPYIMGTKVDLNPLAVIFFLLVGNFIWGAMGMILAVPAIAVIKMILDNIEELQPYGRVLGTEGNDK